MSTKPVRTYLDPDAVGPLPRATVADDSDAMSAARTILRVPGTTTTQEIQPGDVLDVYDPNRRPESLAPTAYDTSGYRVPRTNLARYVVAALAVSGVILVVAATRTFFTGQPSVAEGARRNSVAVAAPQAPEPRPTSAPAIPPPPPSSPAITTGTLLVDPAVQGQRLMLDGVLLSVPAAITQCGPHEVAIGPSGHSRTIDVPCGGEVTVYR
ncbi:MAG TPA: hypothetical protein VMI75_12760 [Polyangiaceae bacterium]|nr:hypothetical protein [Polyangiaceae bacterium]